MANNYTTNYQLNQWEPTDQVLRTDFNADNAKVDAALDGLEHGKAAQDEVDVLTDTVAALAETVTALSGNMGNCTIYRTSYVGTGTYGTESPNSITFPKQPLLVIIGGPSIYLVAVRGITALLSTENGESNNLTGTWSGTALTVAYNGNWGGGDRRACNEDGASYRLIALLDLAE